MLTAATRLEKILKDTPSKLKKITDNKASERAFIAGWSKKEVLGHLIDSAANNHQRFVRMQKENNLNLPLYSQNEWVEVQHYNTRKWSEITELWVVYNRHLLHILKNMDEFKLNNEADFPTYGTLRLQFIIDDYVDHMEHHLKQLFN